MSEHGYLTPDDLRRAQLAEHARLQSLAALLPKPWEHGPDQRCDERCVCPVHNTPLIYWPAGNDHACQDAGCRYGHGMKSAGPVRPDEEPT